MGRRSSGSQDAQTPATAFRNRDRQATETLYGVRGARKGRRTLADTHAGDLAYAIRMTDRPLTGAQEESSPGGKTCQNKKPESNCSTC